MLFPGFSPSSLLQAVHHRSAAPVVPCNTSAVDHNLMESISAALTALPTPAHPGQVSHDPCELSKAGQQNPLLTHHIWDAAVPQHRTAVAPMAWEPSWPPRAPCPRGGRGTGPCWQFSAGSGWFFGTASPSSSAHSARRTCLQSTGVSAQSPAQIQLKLLRKLLGTNLKSSRANTPGSSLIFEAIPTSHSFWSGKINFQNRRYFLSLLFCI